MNDEGKGYKIFRMGEVQNGRLVDTGRMKFADIGEKEFEKYRLQCGDILFNRTNSFEPVGKTGIYKLQGEHCFASYLVRLHLDKNQIVAEFLNYLMNSTRFQNSLKSKASKSINQANINATILCDEVVSFPKDLGSQRQIVQKLNALLAATSNLASIYQEKITALSALKKSLLHQSFSGQLTGVLSIVSGTAYASLFRIPGITPNDLHAGILAMAYQFHQKHGNDNEFGHVKAEKIAHMIEGHLNIELGRKPVKDAAGPVDYGHLRDVDRRAKMKEWFKFEKTESGRYRFEQLDKMGFIVGHSQLMLGRLLSAVEKLLQWMLPMTWQQAEIVATVFAGWNNLLLDGKQPTDEEIVRESREDWHPEKMNIERERFFNAIRWLRKEGVVPKGKGRRCRSGPCSEYR
jgi:type I restriction enzyme, S subunit